VLPLESCPKDNRKNDHAYARCNIAMEGRCAAFEGRLFSTSILSVINQSIAEPSDIRWICRDRNIVEVTRLRDALSNNYRLIAVVMLGPDFLSIDIDTNINRACVAGEIGTDPICFVKAVIAAAHEFEYQNLHLAGQQESAHDSRKCPFWNVCGERVPKEHLRLASPSRAPFPLQLNSCGGKDPERPLLYLTRKAEFAASHYYHNPELSPEENRRLFGKCNNPNGHGHNYVLEVTVKGEVDPRSGFVVDLKQLKETMNREVLDAMDHRFLNKEVPEFFTRIPTTENLAIAIWQRLAPKLTNARLHRVRVYENHDLFVDFYGEE
jgi:6-pyruvoyltetrahydropterin/6-carboxytetrahydropterin synthase